MDLTRRPYRVIHLAGRIFVNSSLTVYNIKVTCNYSLSIDSGFFNWGEVKTDLHSK